MTPRWWSQPFRPEGDGAAEGIRKQLGAPELDPLTILVREMAQNAWDARATGAGPVRFTISLNNVGPDSAAEWRRLLLPGPPRCGHELENALGAEGFRLLVVSDRGTTGLGGAIRSDTVSTESPDFVNFIRNVGEARDRELGGGTYGFGKGILYRISRPHVVLTDTRCRFGGLPQRRLMAAALGDSFEVDGRRFTGRHWWGLVGDDDVPDPALDHEAEALAELLGLPGFGDDFGTTIAVVDPDLGATGEGESAEERGPDAAAALLVSSLLWYLWPKLVPRDGRIALEASVEVDGHRWDIPDPTGIARLQPFVHALRKLDDGEGTEHRRSSDNLVTGTFAGVEGTVFSRFEHLLTPAEPFRGPPHHCARMRDVELVVDYVEGPPPADETVNYGAVFRASAEADPHFAEAEPPTHDSWVLNGLSGTTRGVVQGARTFVRNQLQLLAPRPDFDRGGDEKVPLGRLAAELAGMLPVASGQGGGGGTGGGGGGGRNRGRPWRFTRRPHLTVVDGETLVVARIAVEPSAVPLTLVAEAEVGVDGGRETRPPVGATRPEVLRWVTGDNHTVDGARLGLERGAPTEWQVVVRPADDAATRLTVRVVESGDE